jgi:hypothetical protein
MLHQVSSTWGRVPSVFRDSSQFSGCNIMLGIEHRGPNPKYINIKTILMFKVLALKNDH